MRLVTAGDPLEQAAQDVLAIVRAMYFAAREPTKRRALAAHGRELKEACAVLAQQPRDSQLYRSATVAVDRILNAVSDSMHYQESLHPIWGAAASRLRKVK
jgi:hypothetical protein